MKLALRIEVATLRGAREAAPRLAALLGEHGAGATFLFNLGPDRAGRAWDSLPRVPRLECYGARALVSGTLLPAPDIARCCAAQMRAVRDAGFEAGILAFDWSGWIRRAPRATEAWTRDDMVRARDRYEQVFGEPALVRGAPGWRMNRYAYRYTQRLGFRHSSDSRGSGPFIPVFDGEIAACPQLPTTLPTLDELMAQGLGPGEAVQRLADAVTQPSQTGHVHTLRAEIEGTVFEPSLHALLARWREAGCDLVSLQDYAAGLDVAHLPRRVVIEQAVPGMPGAVSTAGKEFLQGA